MQEAEDIALRALETKKQLLLKDTREIKITQGILGFISSQQSKRFQPTSTNEDHIIHRLTMFENPHGDEEECHDAACLAIDYFEEALETGMIWSTTENCYGSKPILSISGI